MFEIKEIDKGVELYFSNAEEHAKTGCMLKSSTHTFTFDEWIELVKEALAMTDKITKERKHLGRLIADAMFTPTEMDESPEPEAEEWPQVKGRADEILDALMAFGPLTYNELAEKMDVTYQRVVRLVSQMIRDGIRLNREGRPRKVSLG